MNSTTLTVAPRKPLNLNFWNLRKEMRSRTKALNEATRNKCFHADLVVINNLAVIESSQEIPKSLMCGSLNGQPIAEDNYHLIIGDNYDETRISTLQSNKIQSGCKDSNSKNRQSLQVQYQLPHYMDSEIQTKSLERQGGRCA